MLNNLSLFLRVWKILRRERSFKMDLLFFHRYNTSSFCLLFCQENTTSLIQECVRKWHFYHIKRRSSSFTLRSHKLLWNYFYICYSMFLSTCFFLYFRFRLRWIIYICKSWKCYAVLQPNYNYSGSSRDCILRLLR